MTKNKDNIKDKHIPVFRPNYGREEIKAVTEVLKSGWIGLGPKTEEFEEKFAEYVGAKYAVALNSATAGLHLSLLAADVGKGDEVITTPLTFVSTAHAILYVGAKPVFADIEKDTLNISLEEIRKKITKKTKAIIPVHYGGQPCDLIEILKLAKEHDLVVIEDAAHAAGAEYQARMIGSISPFTCFSFHAVKNLATGDGGMITTNNKKAAERLKRLRWVGITKDTWSRLEEVVEGNNTSYRGYGWYYEVSELGYKYHMNDISAAIGLEQLKKLDKVNQIRRDLAKIYDDELCGYQGIECIKIKKDVLTAQHNFVIRHKKRDELHLYLREKGVSTGVHYMPVHLHPLYRNISPKVSLPVVEEEWKKLLTLPLYPQLTKNEVREVIFHIKSFIKKNDK